MDLTRISTKVKFVCYKGKFKKKKNLFLGLQMEPKDSKLIKKRVLLVPQKIAQKKPQLTHVASCGFFFVAQNLS